MAKAVVTPSRPVKDPDESRFLPYRNDETNHVYYATHFQSGSS